ncbi:MAG TPA: LUD domain-containing protein [Solirubrobacteraceae bacterium]|nr:LUD domain-containing protein [Solirubrobacteraceae bacterium]
MSVAREEILGRIRSALADVPANERPADVPVAREYARHGEPAGEALVMRFAGRLRDYDAEVRRVSPAEVAPVVGAALAEMRCRSVVVPRALRSAWRPSGISVIEDGGLTAHQLDEMDGAVTGCAGAIAETGTLILDGQGESGRRIITLVPDHHVCIVTAEQIHGTVPEAVTALGPAVRRQGVPVTLVSGPSASSDIELSRVEGVHGPRHLVVVIVAGPATA